MSDSPVFQQVVKAVDALKVSFGHLGATLYEHETISQYELPVKAVSLDWLRQELEALAQILLPVGFSIEVTIQVYDFQVKLAVLNRASAVVLVLLEAVEEETTEISGEVPAATVVALEQFKLEFQGGTKEHSLPDILSQLDTLTRTGVALALSLRIFLDKSQVSAKLLSPVPADKRAKVITFLFPEVLVQNLERFSLADLEKEFFQPEQRTVILVSAFSGYLESGLLAICGHGHNNELENLLVNPISDDLLKKHKRLLELRQSTGVWLYPAAWLAPDIFDFTRDLGGEAEITAQLRRVLKTFRALLAAIFLADTVEFSDDRYRVEYKGFGRVRLSLTREQLAGYEDQLDPLCQLYTYASEGFSPDKVEFTQQFLSLAVSDVATLCSKAKDIQDATKKNYELALKEKVEDYFDIRHNIQERIKTAVEETSTSVISLSRDVSDDLYKIAGVIAAAVVGSLLDPEVKLWAALGAALVTAVYLCLVIFYHLRTVQQAYDLGMEQHRAYILSYQDVLQPDEIQAYLGNRQLGSARALFDRRRRGALIIYSLFLAAALIVALVMVFVLVNAPTPALHPTPTP